MTILYEENHIHLHLTQFDNNAQLFDIIFTMNDGTFSY